MIRKMPRSAKTLIGDGAYDYHLIRDLMKKRGRKVFAPPPKNGVCRGIDQDRNQAIKEFRVPWRRLSWEVPVGKVIRL